MRVRAGDDDDHVLAVVADEDDRHARRRVDLCARQSDSRLAESGERLARRCASPPTQPTMRTLAPSRAAATAWFAPLPPGIRSSVGAAQRLPGRGSALDPCDEVEVDRPDDG